MNACSLNYEFWLNELMVVPMYERTKLNKEQGSSYCLSVLVRT